ncbi:MAG: LamG domain-containing protein [Crocinitomicaceae bacterium]|nr:LamG domain-containing protein [Flavobacteriales bacterium]NQZ37143.1 LamG domain-containing protein [Crocinitomicaceae bacterium]
MKKKHLKKAISRSSLAFVFLALTASFTSEPIEDNKSNLAPSDEVGVTGELYRIKTVEDLKGLNATEIQFKNVATGHYIILKNDPRGGGVLECSDTMQMNPWYLYQAESAEFNNFEIKMMDAAMFNWSNYPMRTDEQSFVSYNHAKRHPNNTAPGAPHDWTFFNAENGNIRIEWKDGSQLEEINLPSYLRGSTGPKVITKLKVEGNKAQLWEIYVNVPVEESIALDNKQYIRVENASSLNPTGALSLKAKIKTKNTEHQIIIHKWAGGRQYSLEIYEGKPTFVLKWSGPNVVVSATENVTINEWTTITGTFDGITARLYVNGVEKGFKTIDRGNRISLNVGNGPLIIGKRSDAAPTDFDIGYFHGSMEDVSVHNTCLTPEQLNGASIPSSSYQLLFNHFEPGVKTITDNSTNNNTGTVITDK